MRREMEPVASAGSAHAEHWTLDPNVIYTNHGSFGACPRAVLDFQAELRARLEREPVDFFVRRGPALLSDTRASLGEFVGADPDGLAFVNNATVGVNTALRAWDLGPDDEILTTDHAYAACRKAAEFVASRRRGRVRVARVPFPLREPGEAVEAALSAVSPRTRIALIDHVTSPTAIVFPLQEIVQALRARGVETIVDGAHALGMVPLELDRLGAACYTANAHKWLCAPKGAAFLHVRRDLRGRIRPLVVSHGYDPARADARFREEWDWTGTNDPTAWLSIPESLRFLGSLLPGGWPALMERNHALAVAGRRILMEKLGLGPPCPESMLGAMASLPLPAAEPGSPAARLDQDELASWFRDRGIESWFTAWPGPAGKLVRLSAQAYNHEGHFSALAELLSEALRAG